MSLRAADTTPPSIVSVDPPPSSTVSNLTSITVTFTEPVLGVYAGDFYLNGAVASAVSGANAVYTFSFPPPASGTVQIRWDINHTVADLAGNRFDENAPGGFWSYTSLDATAPAMESVSPPPGAFLAGLDRIEVIFSEPVTGVDATDLLINGQPADAVEVLSSSRFLFAFDSPPDGSVTVAWKAGHGIADTAQPPNGFPGGSWTYAKEPGAAFADVVINEIMAENLNGLTDEDNHLNDWIELYNRGPDPVRLLGWSLTDDPDQPGLWQFPDIVLNSGAYLVVFASGKNRAPTNANAKLHTSFRLNGFGDYLGLYNSQFPRQAVSEYNPGFPEQRMDTSFGLSPDGLLVYFENSTPGAPNPRAPVYLGMVAQPEASVRSGLFKAPFELTLTTASPGAEIYYTVDGTPPATNSLRYTNAITIAGTASKAVINIQAAAFKTGWLSSPILTRTYIFPDLVVYQPPNPAGFPTTWVSPGSKNDIPADYEMDQDARILGDPQKRALAQQGLTMLPTLSIVAGVNVLFGADTGVYVARDDANQQQINAELIYPDGQEGFNVPCGLEIQGGTSPNDQGTSWKSKKLSMRLLFKGDFGAQKLNYRVFPDSQVDRFNTLILDAGLNYVWHYNGGSSTEDQRIRAQYIRDQFMSDLQNAMGRTGPYGRWMHVYLNGLYWGFYLVHERPDDSFAAEHFGGDEEEYDALRHNSGNIVAGNNVFYNQMLSAARAGLASNANYENLQQYLDLPWFVDYMIMNLWAGNDDWAHQNWYCVHRRTPEGRLRYISWDAEHVLKSLTQNSLTKNDSGGPTEVLTLLRNNAEFRLKFADHVHKHFFNRGVFYVDPENPVPNPNNSANNVPASLYMRRANEILPTLIGESARWGDSGDQGTSRANNPLRLETDWYPEYGALMGWSNSTGHASSYNYFPTRSATVLGHFRSAGLYPTVAAPTFNQHGGRVGYGFELTMGNPGGSGILYYTLTGEDPRVYGTGTVSPQARQYQAASPLELTSSVVIKARVLNGSTWSALNEAEFTVGGLGVPLRITEIMYNPAPGGNPGDPYEFIEIQNVGGTPLDVSGFYFDGVTLAFPPGTVIPSGARWILASNNNTNLWKARYPGVAIAGVFGGKLSDNGESLAIYNALHQKIVSVDYLAGGGWSVEASGLGYSLEIIDSNGDPDDPANWRASANYNGTPGVGGSLVAPPILINEVLADNVSAVTNQGTLPDWVELHNPGLQAVDLAGWSLTDDGNARKFVFPANTVIQSGDYLVIWCDTNFALPGLHSGFGISRNGESIFLYNASTARVDAISIGLQLPDYSVGLVAGEWRLTVPTPNAANQPATTAPQSSLAINEWLANPLPGASDWIELFNRSLQAPVELRGLYLGRANGLFQIQSLSFVGPNGFVLLWADQQPGPDRIDFNLPAEGGSLAIYSSSGAFLSQVNYGAQMENVSQGRIPDGTGNVFTLYPAPSPGASNFGGAYFGPRINEVMAANRQTITNAYGHTADWVEFYNPSNGVYDVSGMRLSDDPGDPEQWVFPTTTTIPANGYLVVWFDNNAPTSTNSGAFLNTGRALSGSSDEVWLFNRLGQPVDQVVFGFQVPDLSLGRVNSVWLPMASPTPGATNDVGASLGAATSLTINEWMANPAEGDDWFEIFNASDSPVSLEGLYLTDDPSLAGLTKSVVAPLSFIGPRGFVRVVSDGNPSAGRDHANFNLSASGETIRIYTPDGAVIDSVYFGYQPSGVSQGRLPDGTANIVSFSLTPTPGEGNYVPLTDLVVNEILTHTDLPKEDAVEFLNRSASPIDISGYYLSDDPMNLKKYVVQLNTIVPGHGFRVLYAYQFDGGTGSLVPFNFDSAMGDQVWLSQADTGGNLTGYRAFASFGPAANGVSFGRFETSFGVDYVPLSQLSFGADSAATVQGFRTGTGLPNAYPRVGPVVINEIMFAPQAPSTNVNVSAFEYLEIYNDATAATPLFDPAYPTNTWHLEGGVDLVFPTGLVLPPRSSILAVGFDPVADPVSSNAFRAFYGLTSPVPMIGPWQGRLNNAGERVELRRPDTPQGPGPNQGFVPYLLVEAVDYRPDLPWPEGANGEGASLQRVWPAKYGNDPLNWKAQGPTPGRANVPGYSGQDNDSDGMDDQWEDQHAFSSSDPADALLDADNDGLTNYEEFLLGTDPRNDASLIGAPALVVAPTNLFLELGQPAVFVAQTTFPEISTYRWLVNEMPIADAYAPILTLTDLTIPDLNEYRVVAVNLSGSVTSAPAHITFVSPPASLTITSGWTTNFTVVALGPGALTYQWRLNGIDIANANNSTIEIVDAQAEDAGDYTVVISDGPSTYVSPPATLLVAVRPVITQQPTPPSLTAAVGDRVSISMAAEGSMPIWFRWRRQSVTMDNLPVYSGGGSTWVIESLQPEDATYWDVVVTNQAGYATPRPLSDRFYINVVTNLPASWAVHPGTNLVLTVGAKGLQAMSYQWQFNGVDIGGQTGKSLVINDVQEANVGRYSVSITTTNTSYTTPPAWVSFLFAPTASAPAVLQDGSFSLELTGNKGMTYQVESTTNLVNWTVEGSFVQTNDQTKVVIPANLQLDHRFFRVRLAE